MKTSQAAFDLIKKSEGLRLRPYICDGGKLTVGYGSTGRHVRPDVRITEEQAEEYLRNDIKHAERAVRDYVHVPLHQEHFDALVSFIFNVGVRAFANSTLLKKLNAGEYLEASEEFDRWVYAGGKKLAGLIKRRNDEEKLFLSLPWREPKPKE